MRDDLDIVSSEIFRSSSKKQFGEKLDTLFRGTCYYIVHVCYRGLNLQMHTLFAVGPH